MISQPSSGRCVNGVVKSSRQAEASPVTRPRPARQPPIPPAGGQPDRDRVWLALWDSIGETLAGIARDSQDALLQENAPPEAADRLRALRRKALDGLEDLKVGKAAADRMGLRKRGLCDQLRAMGRRFAEGSGIPTDMRLPRGDPEITEEAAAAILTVADEALEGLVRRSRATGVVLELGTNDERILLTVRDDGVSLLARQGPNWRASPHASLRGISRALEQVRGTVSVAAVRPRGIVVRASIPVSEPPLL